MQGTAFRSGRCDAAQLSAIIVCLSFFALETESTLALESDMLCWTLISSKDLL